MHDTGLAQMWKASRRRWDASGALWEKGGTHGCPCVAVSGHQGVWASVGEWGGRIDHWRHMEDMEHKEHKTYYVEGGSGRQWDEQEACVRVNVERPCRQDLKPLLTGSEPDGPIRGGQHLHVSWHSRGAQTHVVPAHDKAGGAFAESAHSAGAMRSTVKSLRDALRLRVGLHRRIRWRPSPLQTLGEGWRQGERVHDSEAIVGEHKCEQPTCSGPFNTRDNADCCGLRAPVICRCKGV